MHFFNRCTVLEHYKVVNLLSTYARPLLQVVVNTISVEWPCVII